MSVHDKLATKLNDIPCPRCGCYLIAKFECFCGAVHSDYCVNCGRWVGLLPTEAIELGPVNVKCNIGRVEHEHSDEEKCERVAAYFEYVKKNKIFNKEDL